MGVCCVTVNYNKKTAHEENETDTNTHFKEEAKF